MIFFNPRKLLGKVVKIYLYERANDKAAFYFKVMSIETINKEKTYLVGFDDEGRDLKISIDDIEFAEII